MFDRPKHTDGRSANGRRRRRIRIRIRIRRRRRRRSSSLNNLGTKQGKLDSVFL